MNPEEYLRHEYEADERHEWRDGIVTPRQGGPAEHSLICANFLGAVRDQLKGSGCRLYESNLRVRSVLKLLYTYPDATIICSEPQFDPQDVRRQTVINPKVVIEVLSPSTEGDDRGDKFARYRGIDSLEEYVLVSQTSPNVETFLRRPDGAWLYHCTEGLEATATLRSVAVELPLAEVYAGVEFAPRPDEAPERPND